MFKRDQESNRQFYEELAEAEVAREEETNRRLAELIARERAEQAEESTRTRGHATRVLRTKTDQLRAMLPYFSLGKMVELLAESGVHVNYHSLRNFLRKHMTEDYLEHVAIGRTMPIPEKLRDSPISAAEEREVFGVKEEQKKEEPQKTSEKLKRAENLSDLQQISRNDVDTSEYEYE